MTFNAPLKDSGSRQAFETGAVRDAGDGKGMPELLPAEALLELSKHFEKGAKKYAARNWEKGIPYSKFIGPMLRHTFKHLAGYTDEPHLTAAVWNGICLMQTMLWVQQGILPGSLNDLPIRDITHIDHSFSDETCVGECGCNCPTAIEDRLQAQQAEAIRQFSTAIDGAEQSDSDMIATGFTIGDDNSQYWWDGIGSVTWNDNYGVIKHAAFSVADAYEHFASGEWTVAPYHSRIVLRRFIPVNPGSSSVVIRFEVAQNEFFAYFNDLQGRDWDEVRPQWFFETSEDWTEA